MRRLVLPLLLLAIALPARAEELLQGAKLVLKKASINVVSTDPAITVGANEGADDPVVHGATLRLASVDGDGFDTTIDLPAKRWRYVGKKGAGGGYRYKGRGAVRSVLVKPGGLLRVQGKGKGLGVTLGASPAPVHVVLTLGGRAYCLTFGGTVEFKANARFAASAADAPALCPIAYGEDASWLCRPGGSADACFVTAIDSTEVHPDTSTTPEPHAGTEDQLYDCFYVYPTVDLLGGTGLHLDITDNELTLDPLTNQVQRFNTECRIFAPLYRQITLGTFGAPDAEYWLNLAYQDVRDAWRYYLKNHNGGRNVVIMGHSQGTFMLTRLLQEEFDDDPELRGRLIAALLIGGSVSVPKGGVVGGSFQNIPLCTGAAETGCVIAYRTYGEGFPPVGNGNAPGDPSLDQACTNPAALAGGEGTFARSYLPTFARQPLFDPGPNPWDTPFVLFRSFFAGACVSDSAGYSYLEIRARPAVGDLRINPVDFARPLFDPAFLGTHVLDWNFPLGELIELVATKAAAMP